MKERRVKGKTGSDGKKVPGVTREYCHASRGICRFKDPSLTASQLQIPAEPGIWAC